MRKELNIGIIGASGLVGRTMLQVLLERNFPCRTIRLFASARSAGQSIVFNNGVKFVVEELQENSFEDLDIALFSAGATVSEKYVPIAVISDCVAIDNGSFWRMNDKVPLVVPEVNAVELYKHRGIICNPNCSTIQLVVVLNALQQLGNVKRVIVSTYQSVSGGGQKWLDKYQSEMIGKPNSDKYKIFNSIMFHSAFNEAGSTDEEAKMHAETKKILNNSEFKISATCVRIPVENSHCESVNVEFDSKVELNHIINTLSNTNGVVYVGGNEDYPTPLLVAGKDSVFVGRVRSDNSNENAINLWIVADNLRKGAATNAVQIAEYIVLNSLFDNFLH